MATPELPKIELAKFKTLTGSPTVELEVHFNPETLEYTISNTLKEEGKGSKKKQFIDKSSAKLSMQLVFDTTHNGEDVRVYTDKVAALLKPVGGGKKQVPPNVEFSWGLYRFTGMVESHKEIIDFFAPSGVPLRATVDLTLASQDVQFESATSASVDKPGKLEPAVVPAGGGPSQLANALGDPRGARAIASLNASVSLRFGAEGELAVGADVELQAEAGFSAGAAAGAGFGIGIGGGGGVGVGLPSAVAAGGAFSELRAGVTSQTSLPSGQAVFQASPAVGAVGGGAQFGIGGAVGAGGGASLGADVGAEADLNALIRFG